MQKTALPPEVMEKRLAWAKHELRLKKLARWYFRHVLWFDLCNSILPRSEAKAKEQALARKGNRGWMSDLSAEYSRNLRGNQTATKQKSWDTERVWWAPMLVRGKLHIEVLPQNFPGETPEGVAIIVRKIPAVLNARFPQASKPKVLMTDRGRGFFQPCNGLITDEYLAALQETGLRAHQGDDASVQPGNLQDVVLHETAVSWVRHLLERTLPKRPWEETCAAYGSRLREVCGTVNANHDVEGLCLEFPERLQAVVDKLGDRLRT